MKNPWKTIKKNIIYANKYGFILRDDDVINPKGNKGKFMVLEHTGSVFTVALTKENKCIFVRQWRYPIERESLELVAGNIDTKENHETALSAAKRELLEETGAISSKWSKLGVYWLGDGFMKKKEHIFLAEDVEFVKAPRDEETEKLEIELIDLDKAIKMILNNDFQDERTPLGLLLAKEVIERRERHFNS